MPKQLAVSSARDPDALKGLATSFATAPHSCRAKRQSKRCRKACAQARLSQRSVEKKLPAAENSSEAQFLPIAFSAMLSNREISPSVRVTYVNDKVWQHSCGTPSACLILNTLRAFGEVRCQGGPLEGTCTSRVERQKHPSRSYRIQWKYPKTKPLCPPQFG
jgi:hypothetical protein